MNIFILKLIMAPLIIGSASLAGRRWGSAVSGWIVGMPLTSGPVVFFVALSHNAVFAAATALGVLSGGFSLVIYALTYAWLAKRFRWPVALAGSLFLFGISTILLRNADFPLVPLFLEVSAAIALGLYLMPKNKAVEMAEHEPGRWDLFARILIGTSFILLLTGGAAFLGSRLTGLLATIPLYVSVLTVFAHQQQGSAAAAHVLRGLLYGMFAFAGFFIVLGLLIERAGIAASFLAAIVTALAIQGISLWVLRQTQK